MTDRPILFSGPKVSAILDGHKTQTRRVLKLGNRRPDYIGPRGCTDDPSCWGWEMDDGDFWRVQRGEDDHLRSQWTDWVGAYRPGDRLWVREAHYLTDDGDSEYAVFAEDQEAVAEHLEQMAGLQCSHPQVDWSKHLRLRPSIHMPRWASRLTLIVTDVRVQRLQDISEVDAVAEGAPRCVTDGEGAFYVFDDPSCGTHQCGFAGLWDSLNAKRAPWSSNPWVCAVTFEAHRKNIDQMGARDA